MFFESNYTKCPQFKYKNPEAAAAFLSTIQPCDGEYIKIAQAIITSLLEEYKNETNYLNDNGA